MMLNEFEQLLNNKNRGKRRVAFYLSAFALLIVEGVNS